MQHDRTRVRLAVAPCDPARTAPGAARAGAPKVAEAAPGFYLLVRPTGFAVHMSASADHLRFVRQLADATLTAAGVDTELAQDVQLVASELIGNSVRACGDLVPLVVEVDADPRGVSVKVHDPDRRALPRRSDMPSDCGAESGRGLPLVDLLAPGWRVSRTPIGKQICCHLPYRRRVRR
ncbi:ATP-binding protein [Streptacidiphilus sp. PB12-B1b]|uniref:ATP-binding protein n=1 Tax=Streptacidiphilus sp. PB12-B1b TaxID=2705012 RepID=UPI0015FAFB36|nr:ATP-binding protein [Streptacidiphilus sp. PB12-B1b]QMU77687.1 ATP-binding protein [Streptacidiphilus sp. PB12-B1b]